MIHQPVILKFTEGGHDREIVAAGVIAAMRARLGGEFEPEQLPFARAIDARLFEQSAPEVRTNMGVFSLGQGTFTADLPDDALLARIEELEALPPGGLGAQATPAQVNEHSALVSEMFRRSLTPPKLPPGKRRPANMVLRRVK